MYIKYLNSGNMRKILSIFAIGLLFLLQETCKIGEKTKEKDSSEITFVSLLNEMTNREAITRYPAYRLKQVSSYDRTETNPADSSTWFNNKDYGYYIRKEIHDGRTEYVILEEFNPGSIVRWWIPLEETYKNRVVRIYLDGSEIPVIEENYHEFMSGKSFVKWPFAFISSDEKDSAYQIGLPVGHPKQMGADMYLPVPFAKSCKITLDDDPFYYVIDYRVYSSDTKVESFTMDAFNENQPLIETISKKLAEKTEYDFNFSKNQQLNPDEDLVIKLPVGQNAIKSIQIALDPDIHKESLRSLVLEASFDNEECIWCPVSEFFGEGVYIRPVENRNNRVTDTGRLQSYWIMPYQKSSIIKLKNYGDNVIKVNLKVATKPYHWGKRSMYFHSNWHEEAPIKTSSPRDWNYNEIEGRGIYAGDVLTVHSFSKGWWGEGDEKVAIDYENLPSQLGTGLEDYYGYAWGMAHHFNSPFISMPLRDARGKGDWRGYTTVSRMRLLDGIPFEQHLNFNVEAWLHDSTVSYSVATFWYGFPTARSNIKNDSLTIRRALPDFVNNSPAVYPGKIYPDPAAKGPFKAPDNGPIKQVGNHIDLVGWQDKDIFKPLDPDHDNIYGTAGYYLIAGKILDARKIIFSADTLFKTPSFVKSIKLNGLSYFSMQDSWLKQAGKPDLYLITGGVEISGKTQADIAYIKLGNNVPETFRLGIIDR